LPLLTTVQPVAITLVIKVNKAMVSKDRVATAPSQATLKVAAHSLVSQLAASQPVLQATAALTPRVSSHKLVQATATPAMLASKLLQVWFSINTVKLCAFFPLKIFLHV